MESIHARISVSVTELKRNLAKVLSKAQSTPIAVLNHNKPEAYLLSAGHYEKILALLEDFEDKQLVTERSDGPFIEVTLDDLCRFPNLPRCLHRHPRAEPGA